MVIWYAYTVLSRFHQNPSQCYLHFEKQCISWRSKGFQPHERSSYGVRADRGGGSPLPGHFDEKDNRTQGTHIESPPFRVPVCDVQDLCGARNSSGTQALYIDGRVDTYSRVFWRLR